MTNTDDYALAVGDHGATRLRLLDGVYGPGTRELLSRVGVRDGMHALDIGCGIGSVSRWLATLVGPGGRVVAADANADQLAVARRASEGHPNLSFVEANAYGTGLPRGSFDIVYSRLLLMHLSRPVDALREMKALLRPGGVLVCEDTEVDATFCEPPCPAQKRLHALATALGSHLDCDFNVGRRLYRHMLAAGFTRPEISQHQPVFVSGESKRLEAMSFREVAPRVIAAGLATQKETDDIVQELERIAADETVVYWQSRMTQVWARV